MVRLNIQDFQKAQKKATDDKLLEQIQNEAEKTFQSF